MKNFLCVFLFLFTLSACASVPRALAKYKKLSPSPENSIPRTFLVTQKGRALILEGASAVQFVYQKDSKKGRAVYIEGLYAPNAQPQLTLMRSLEVTGKTLNVYDDKNVLVESFTLLK